jgi:hypothetical protein
MAHGGSRSGAGRKPKADEEKARELAINSIIATHGSLEEGFSFLLGTKDASLIKFVFEHAVGKPKDKIEHSGDQEAPVIFKADDRFADNS